MPAHRISRKNLDPNTKRSWFKSTKLASWNIWFDGNGGSNWENTTLVDVKQYARGCIVLLGVVGSTTETQPAINILTEFILINSESEREKLLPEYLLRRRVQTVALLRSERCGYVHFTNPFLHSQSQIFFPFHSGTHRPQGEPCTATLNCRRQQRERAADSDVPVIL